MEKRLRIPEERVAPLIGEDGRDLESIEGMTDTEIEIEDNRVTITGEALNVWQAKDVVRAVGRGFSPERALRLLEGDVLRVVELNDLNRNRLREVRGRIIGSDGRMRETIEARTGTDVSVYGKTVSIIGSEESVGAAVHAVEMLVEGSKHGTVYSYLKEWEEEQKARSHGATR